MKNWENIIWINESSFEVDNNLQLMQVWHQVYKRYFGESMEIVEDQV